MPQSTNRYLERLPSRTNSAHCASALSMVESGDLYFGIGKSTPWPGDESDANFIPPINDIDARNLDELIAMIKAHRVSMVIPDDRHGTIEYEGIKFRPISNEEALEERSRWVLLEGMARFDELPSTAYRQIGVFSRVKTKPGNESKEVLLPSEIENVGILEIIQNRKAVRRQSDVLEKYIMIIEF